MSTQAHTAGPWEAVKGVDNDTNAHFYAPEGDEGAEVWGSVISGDEWYVARIWACDHLSPEANARLIAAAPDMLAALKEAATVLEGCRYSEKPAAKKLRELIAKVEGRS